MQMTRSGRVLSESLPGSGTACGLQERNSNVFFSACVNLPEKARRGFGQVDTPPRQRWLSWFEAPKPDRNRVH